MFKNLPDNKKIVSISEAAEVLGVSIDTIRRWDKAGILHSSRPNGKNRYFSVFELEKVKFSKALSIGEAAARLGISPSTLRRLEERGLLTPQRDNNGERVYTLESLEKFLHSEYFLREKEIQEKILEPLKESKVASTLKKSKEETTHKILGAVEAETRQQVLRLNNFRKAFFASGILIAITFILIISIITILFLLFPEDTAKFFGYRTSHNNPKVAIQTHQKQGAILGARAPNTETKQKVEALGAALKPFSKISLGVVKQINPKVYEKVVPTRVIEDVSDILTIDEEGNIVPHYNIKLPDSTYLQVSDKGLIKNLNAEWIRGKAPEDGAGDLVVYDKNNSTISNLRINSANINNRAVVGGVGGIILDSSITSEDLANNAVTTLKIADSAITSAKLASGVGGTPGDDSVTSAKIKDGEVKNADLADGAVTSSKISDNTITATDIAATLTFADGDFLDLAAVVHDDSAVQGLRLPNAASATPTVPTSGEGYIAWDTSGNQAIVYNGSSWSAIGSGLSTDSVLESHLKAVDSATDEECLTYESAVGDFEWQSCGSGGSQTPWTSDIDADGFSLTDFGTNLTSRGGLTIATTTTSALTLDSGTTGTVNLGTGNNAKTVAIGTGTAGNTINIGTNNTTADTISIGSALDSLSLTEADWSITGAGAATFVSVNSGSGTIVTTGTLQGNDFDRSTSGALTFGNTNATSVSICNSVACDTITIGSNADADTITIGDAASDTTTLNGTTVAIDSGDWDISTTGVMTGIGAITSDGAISTTSTLNADGATTLAALTLDANSDLTLLSGTGSVIVTNSVTNASDQVIDINPAFAGGATDALTYTVIDVAAFTPTNAAGTDTIEGLAIRALTQGADAARLTANAITIGDGWDTGITGATYTIDGTTALTIGAGGGTIAVNSSDWDIDATGIMTGIGAITSNGLITTTAGLTVTGAAVSLNASSNFAVNIATGTSTGAVAIGGNSNTVAIDGSNFDIDTAGVVTLTGNLTLSGDASEGLDGGGLTGTDCDTVATSKLLYDDTTNKFSCGTDQNSGGATAWDAIADPAAGADILFNETAQTMTWNTAATAAAFDGLSIGITNDATTDSTTQRGLVVENLASTGSTTTESLIVADNQDTDETVTNGLLIEQSAAGTMTNAIQIAETAGTVTDGILITGTLGNILNSASIDITGAGAITGATGITSSGTITFSGLVSCDTIDTNASGVLSCGTDASGGGVPNMNSFTDSTLAASWTDIDTTELWDDATRPNITPSATTSEILVLVTLRGTITTTGNNDSNPVARVDSETGVTADCVDTNDIGHTFGQAFSDAGVTHVFGLSTIIVHAPATVSNVSYTVCTSADSSGITNTTTGTYTELTLYEINDAADLAELYFANDPNVKAGDVVSLDPSLEAGVKKSGGVYDKNILGVVSTKPALVVGGAGGQGTPVPVALSGRVPVKVVGPIKKGDVLTASSTPGVAMKAAKAGPILGVAMTDFAPENIDQIGSVMLFVKTEYFNGGNLREILQDTPVEITQENIGKLALTHFINEKEQLATSVDLSEIVTDRVAAGLEVITPRVIADEIIARKIKAESIEGIEIMAGQISHLSDQIKSFDDFFSLPNADASPSAILGDSSSVNSSSSALTSLTVDGLATISGQLKTGSLRVLGPALIEGVLSIIDTITAPRVIVTDLATFFGKTIFKDDVEFQGRPIFNKDTAGYAVIKKDTDVVDVAFEKEYSKIPVVNINITLDENTEDSLEKAILNGDVKYIVAKASIKGFKIKLNKKAPEDIKFSWIAITTKDSSVFESLNQTNVAPAPLEQSLTPTVSASDASSSAEIQLDNINPSVQY